MNLDQQVKSERQLEALQRQLTIQRRVLLGLGAALLLIFLTGQSAPNRLTVTAREFVLEDVDGHQRARLHIDNDGAATLRFFDRQGTVRLSMIGGVGLGESILSMNDANGSRRLTLTTGEGDNANHGYSGLGLSDDTGAARVRLCLSDHGEPMLLLRDNWGTGQVELRSTRTGGGYCRLTRAGESWMARPGARQ